MDSVKSTTLTYLPLLSFSSEGLTLIKIYTSYINNNMLSKFSCWLNESVYGQWNYHLPEDKKQQMYDFYMLEYLLSAFPQGSINMTLSGPEMNPFRPAKVEPKSGKPWSELPGEAPMTAEMKYYYSLVEAAQKLIPALKKELLEAVMFALAAELRHLYDRAENRPKELIEQVEKSLGPEEAKLL